jgi:hypothetical protein
VHNVSDDSAQPELTLVLEHFTDELVVAVQSDVLRRSSDALLLRIRSAVLKSLQLDDLPKTRLVITADLVRSVNDREDRSSKPFTMERGSGIVAAKTMPPNANGVVDILVPAHWLVSNDEAGSPTDDVGKYVRHIAAHEAVHASLFHLAVEPFDVHRREQFDDAMLQFVAMASEQVEEHLAEYLAGRVADLQEGTTTEQIRGAFEAWRRILAAELPAIPEDDPNYIDRSMRVSFEATHVLWKMLAYLAAELRSSDNFRPVSAEIRSLSEWKSTVEPWWPEYVSLLAKIPMSTDVDIESTDDVVKSIAELLQRWALGIGFDFHDTSEGAWFQVTLLD